MIHVILQKRDGMCSVETLKKLCRKKSPGAIENMRKAQRKRSPEHARKIAEANRSRWKDPEWRQRWAEGRKKMPKRDTDIERILMAEFKKRRLRFEPQYPYRSFLVDFAFPSVRLMVQADGDYWHRIAKGQKAKDREFNALAEIEGWTVWRFAESEIKMHPEACGRAVAAFVQAHGG